jgi:hypothetical protein
MPRSQTNRRARKNFNAKTQRRREAKETANHANRTKFFSLASPNAERAGVRKRNQPILAPRQFSCFFVTVLSNRMNREEAKAIIEEIRRENLAGNSRHLRGSLKIFAEQLNTEATHFVWELIQNAEDNEYAPDKQAELKLHIDTTEVSGCLVVQNNELGFQEKHVRGIIAN